MVFKRIEVSTINWLHRKLIVNWICFLEWFFNLISIIHTDGNLSCGEVVENRLFFWLLLFLSRWGIYRSFHRPSKNRSGWVVSSRHIYHSLQRRRRNPHRFSEQRGAACRGAMWFSWTRTLTWTRVHSTGWTRTYPGRDKFRIAQWSRQTVHRISRGMKWEYIYQ